MRGRPFRIIAAAVGGQNGGIGCRGKLPWRIKQEMQHFRERTHNCAVIMGRATWDSLPTVPLPHRLNVVITSQPKKILSSSYDERVLVATSLTDALMKLERSHKSPTRTYVIGGEQVYRTAVEHEMCEAIELTNIDKTAIPEQDYDRFFPRIPTPMFQLTKSVPTSFGAYEMWEKIKDEHSPEWSFMNLLRNVRHNGELVLAERSGVGTLQCFGLSVRFSLANDRIPVLTAKRVHWKSVAEEVLQFARGDINARHLEAKGVKIWKGHTSRAHLDSIGAPHVEEGSMWKAYGWQWRHWGLPYLGIHTDYDAIKKSLLQGGTARQNVINLYPQLKHAVFHDQLANLVHLLKTNPSSRRMVLSAWNVADLDQMCLPPCHMLYTFNVTHGRLNCQMTQRSWDLFLGAPFNIAGTALLVRLLCATTELEPGEIKIDAANAHIYLNHVEQVDEMIERAENLGLYRFPTLEIKRKLFSLEDWNTLTADDLVLHGYRSHSAIKAHMAI